MRKILWIVVAMLIVSGSFVAKGEDLKPFELRNVDGRQTLWLHGTEEQRMNVPEDKVHIIMDSIAKGWDIDIKYADIDGDLDISKIADRLEKDEEGGENVIKGNVSILPQS